MGRDAEVPSAELVGGRLCLDFVNTVSWRGAAEPEEKLTSFDALVRFAATAEALSPRDRNVILRAGALRPREARETLHRARRLREALHRIFLAWSKDAAPAAVDLRVLNEATPARGALEWRGGAFFWKRRKGRAPLARLLAPVAWSAADLLAEGSPARLKCCAGERCGWLFYDESRGRRRRWCSMSDCGNRAKAKRHYARHRAG